MVKGIRIYIEGGGRRDNSRKLREGFDKFFAEPRQRARGKNIEFRIILCGSRNEAFKDFLRAEEDHPDTFNILLVDSEGPVSEDDSRKFLQKIVE